MMPSSFDLGKGCNLVAFCLYLQELQNEDKTLAPLSFLIELLFFEMMEPVGQCAFGLSAQNKRDEPRPGMA